MAASRQDRRLDVAAVVSLLLLAGVYAGMVWYAGSVLGVRYPLGSDGPIWFDTARLAAQGQAPGLPPLFPRLLALLSGGDPRVSVGLALNAALVGLLLVGAAVGAALCATSPWARRAALLGAPLLVLSTADPAAYAWFMHPEVLIATLLVWSGALAVLYVRRPSWGTAALLGLCCGLAMSAKEHGLVVAVLAPVGVLALGGPGRWGRLLAWALGLLPMLTLQLLDGALFSKALVSVQESLGWLAASGETLELLPVEMSVDQQQQVRDGGLVAVALGQLVTASRTWWLIYLAACAAGVGLSLRRQWALAGALALPLASLAPAVVLWTEPRHYMVVAPAAVLAAVGAAARLLSPSGARGALGLAAICGLWAALAAPGAGARLSAVQQEIVVHQRDRADEYEALRWLLAHLDPADRLILRVDPVVLGKVPFRQLRDGQPVPGDLAGRVYLVTDREAPAGAWALAETSGGIRIYQHDPPAEGAAPR